MAVPTSSDPGSTDGREDRPEPAADEYLLTGSIGEDSGDVDAADSDGATEAELRGDAPDGFTIHPGLGGMVPDPSILPTDVLPTDRLLAGGKAVPAIRSELRRIPDARNAFTIAWVWAETLGTVALAAWWGHPIGYLAAFLLMGRAFVRFNILGHEAVHRTLFSNKGANDFAGKWLLSYHAFVPFELYRRGHMDHHRDEMGPKEPDTGLYANYPITRASLRRKLIRDATGRSGWKIFKGLVRGTRNPRTRKVARRIVWAQLVLIAIAVAFGRPELWLFLWFLPWLTMWRVVNRLRAIAEHGGMTRSKDRRETTHHVRQGWFARFWMVPYNVGWHLAHHVDMGVSMWNLPRLHRELEESGWVTPEYVWANYRSLWRALSSRPEADPAASRP